MDVVAAAKSAEAIDKSVGIIGKYLGKLKAQPDIAAQKLGQSLEEIAKTLQVVDGATSSFASLAIDEGALDKNASLLFYIESGQLSADVEKGLGSCHQIERIYKKHLNKWFSKALAPGEQGEMKAVFDSLGTADDSLFARLGEVATILQGEAKIVLESVMNDNKVAAKKTVVEALTVLRPLRKTIAGTMQKLYELKNEFADIAAG
jgi:hypothetical protein